MKIYLGTIKPEVVNVSADIVSATDAGEVYFGFIENAETFCAFRLKVDDAKVLHKNLGLALETMNGR